MTEADKRKWKEYEEQNPLNLDYSKPKPAALKSTPPKETNASTVPAKRTTEIDANLKEENNSTLATDDADPSWVDFEDEDDAEKILIPESSSSNTVQKGESPLKTDANSDKEMMSTSVADLPNTPPKDIHTEGQCKLCQKMTTNKCTGCLKVFYCSRDHQKQDWKSGHKKECKGKAVAS